MYAPAQAGLLTVNLQSLWQIVVVCFGVPLHQCGLNRAPLACFKSMAKALHPRAQFSAKWKSCRAKQSAWHGSLGLPVSLHQWFLRMHVPSSRDKVRSGTLVSWAWWSLPTVPFSVRAARANLVLEMGQILKWFVHVPHGILRRLAKSPSLKLLPRSNEMVETTK